MCSRCPLFKDIISGILQVFTGIIMLSVELAIIHMDTENTPEIYKLIHEEVAVKGACQLLGGFLYLVLLCRMNATTHKIRLMVTTANSMNLVFMIWQCAYGLTQINKQCQQYPEFCQPGAQLFYSFSLLRTQESMFTIGFLCNLLGAVLSFRHIGKHSFRSYQRHVDEMISPEHEEHMNFRVTKP